MLYRSMCWSDTCLHGRLEHMLLRDIRSICCPRHVYMIYKSLCSYQQSLHGLQDPVMLADMFGGPQDHMLLSNIPASLKQRVQYPDMSASSTWACAAIRHVCMVYNGVCCSQTCLLGLHEPVMLPDMSAWSTGTCSDPRHACMVRKSILMILHGHIVQGTHRPWINIVDIFYYSKADDVYIWY